MMEASSKCVLLAYAFEDQNFNFMLKPELEPTVIACLAGRDAQEVLYTGFYLSKHPVANSKRLRFLPDICNDDIHKIPFSAKTYTVVNELLNGL